MRWLSPIALFVCVATIGCRSNNSDRAYLYQELREQEDEIYALEDLIDQYEAKVASCRRANQALRREGSEGQGEGNSSSSVPGTFQPPRIDFVPPSDSDTDAPAYEPPDEPLSEPPGTLPLETPEYEMPDVPDVPRTDDSEIRQSSYHEHGPREDAPRRGASRLRFTQDEEEITDYRLDHITLNRQLTGAHNRDGHPGDEGVYIVIEPRNAADQVIDVPGKLTIVVMDPAKRGPDARIARWDYTMEEAADTFRKSLFGRGMHLELPWPAEPPQGRELSLFVRMATADGRRLIAEKRIQADPLLPGDDVVRSRDHSARHPARRELADETANTTRVADASQDHWQRRTRSFQSPVPAPVVQPRSVADHVSQEPEPAIEIPAPSDKSNFIASADDLLARDVGENETGPRSTSPDANDGPESVRYEFAPKQENEPRSEPQPQPAEADPPATRVGQRRPTWSPYR